MAGDWIKFELATLDKPEVCQIADDANLDSDAVIGKLLRVWGWFDQQTSEGNAPSVSKRLLDRLVGVAGFCDLMRKVGWMAEADGVISIPNFARHNGKTAKNRLLTAKRVANHKAANGKGNAAIVSDALPKEDVEKIQIEEQKNTQPPKVAEPAKTVELDLDSTEPTDDLFNRFWQKYPRKTDKTKAKAKWGKLKMTPALFEQIMTSLAAQCMSAGWQKDDGQFIPHPTTWLHNKRWEDEVRPANVHQLRSRHHGFDERDYSEGLYEREDGTYGF